MKQWYICAATRDTDPPWNYVALRHVPEDDEDAFRARSDAATYMHVSYAAGLSAQCILLQIMMCHAECCMLLHVGSLKGHRVRLL